ncbi:hypothetical protein Nepgr_021150 [Nepenthes gracilis]|uniref:Uncharacterized protein n=1 Tax=Nepenthes gracilis TaxID=150966 RepID=A0AAD3SZ10_NEPGR|nr:hypothetical protein Nepgr_021150 [Nepenthes gracilis]
MVKDLKFKKVSANVLIGATVDGQKVVGPSPPGAAINGQVQAEVLNKGNAHYPFFDSQVNSHVGLGPSKTTIKCAPQMVLQLKLQFWILLLGLLAGKPKYILTSFKVSVAIVQEMDNRSRKERVLKPDEEQGVDDIEGQQFSMLKIFPLKGGSVV